MRVLVAVTAQSAAELNERVTPPELRALVVIASRGPVARTGEPARRREPVRPRRRPLMVMTGPVSSPARDTREHPRADLVLWVATAARLLLAVVWIIAGGLKVADLDASVRAVRAYRLLPEVAAQAVGAGLPLLEIVLGLLLLVGLGVRAGAVASAVLLTAFIIGIASAWARGLQIDCGCFGSGGQLATGESPGYGWELARDIALWLVAIALSRRPHGRLAFDNRLGASHDTADTAGKER